MHKIGLLIVGALLIITPALAQKNKQQELLDTFGDWTAYKTTDEKGGKLCYMASVPQKSEGKYKRRGDVLLIIAHRSAEKSFDVVSLTTGYLYKGNNSATVQIDSNKPITLFTHQDAAWAKDSKTDTAIVRQMRAGSTAVFRGQSSFETRTTDTFSLKGFTKAYKAINKACGRSS